MKLYYFNLYARGEPIRMMLHRAGVQFEDIRVGFGKEHEDLKASGLLPNGQMPMLMLKDGTKMV